MLRVLIFCSMSVLAASIAVACGGDNGSDGGEPSGPASVATAPGGDGGSDAGWSAQFSGPISGSAQAESQAECLIDAENASFRVRLSGTLGDTIVDLSLGTEGAGTWDLAQAEPDSDLFVNVINVDMGTETDWFAAAGVGGSGTITMEDDGSGSLSVDAPVAEDGAADAADVHIEAEWNCP